MIKRFVCAVAVSSVALSLTAEPIPAGLSGNWRITRVLASSEQSCWDSAKAHELVGTTLSYRTNAMRWQSVSVPLEGVLTRTVDLAQFRKENVVFGNTPHFAQLGIHSARVTEIDLQHEDSDVTGATTELPGDSVLLVSPTRIVVSACGVFYEATRSAAPSVLHASR